MKSQKSFKIQILYLTGVDYEPFLEFFHNEGDEVEFVMPYKDTEPKDLLILPDTYGFNMTCKSVVMNTPLPLNFPPQHQWMEWFRLYMLDKWISRKAKILALGTSGCVMWEKMGGRNTVQDGMIRPIPGAKNADLGTVNESWYFRGDNVLGFDRVRFNEGWYDNKILPFLIGKEAKEEKVDDNTELVEVA